MAKIGPGTKLGKYTLDGLIATGGFGEVYRARQLGPGGFSKTVAIKVLGAQALTAEMGLETFLREGRVAALLNHRNIVQVHEVGSHRGTHFLVMEYVDGMNLRQLWRRFGAEMPLWLRVGIVLEVCRGLGYAHSFRGEGCPNGVVHRDVKPSNILLSMQGDVKLTDFGLAKPFQTDQDQLTSDGMIKGTPGYMSPEQQAGDEVTAASDVYGLGMVLYAICAQQARRLQPGQLPPPTAYDSRTPASLTELIASAMQPIASHRPDAAVLGEALAHELNRLAPSGAVGRLSTEVGSWVQRARQQQAGEAALPFGGTAELTPPDGGFAPQLVATERAGPMRRVRWQTAAVVLAVAAVAGVAVGLVYRLARPRAPGPPATLALHHDAAAGPRWPDGLTPANRGYLSVDSEPWSWVFVDGVRLGMTPLWRHPLPAGAREVRLVGANGKMAHRRVQVQRARHANLGMVLLR